MTITPTSHAVAIVGGPTASAMCAVDALGIVPMLGRDVTIASTDPYSGEPVFTSHTNANAWLDEHPAVSGVVLTKKQMLQLGVDIFGTLLED
ncbi:MAG TPA: organomercurial lyase [Actinoplanes sp.]|nr:organomercurial lyase [Actinoplanes sp.]